MYLSAFNPNNGDTGVAVDKVVYVELLHSQEINTYFIHIAIDNQAIYFHDTPYTTSFAQQFDVTIGNVSGGKSISINKINNWKYGTEYSIGISYDNNPFVPWW